MLSEQDFELPSNPYDFNSWVALVSKIDSYDSSSMTGSTYDSSIRIFDGFLANFPWLYAYWTKYAHFVWSGRCDLSQTISIFKRALSPNVLRYSVEMWLEYIKFIRANTPASDQETIRSVFAEALDAIGTHYCSGEIWSMAIEFEMDHRRPAFQLLAKAVSCPTNKLSQFWTELQGMLPRVPISQLTQFDKNKSVHEIMSAGELPPSLISGAGEQNIRAERTKIITELYENSLTSISKRYRFEININRHFFHFNSPDEVQIGNWENYASTFEQIFNENPTQENFNAVVEIYERALIPCAFIDSIYLHYADFLEETSNYKYPFCPTIDLARNVYRRMPMKVMPSAEIVYAEFEEANNPSIAESLYEGLAKSNYAEHVIAAAYYFKRLSNTTRAIEILRSGRDRLKFNNDVFGAAAIASELLELANETSDDINEALYASKYAKIISESDPQSGNLALFKAIYSTPDILLENKISLLKIYIEYSRKHGIEAKFQLDLENLYNILKNRLLWHKQYFDQTYLNAQKPPEKKLDEWYEYQASVSSNP